MMKYILTDKTDVTKNGRILHRIQAVKDFADVKAGDLGGWVETEDNLSQEGNCWVYPTSAVFAHAKVSGNAQIHDRAAVCGNATVMGNAVVYGESCGIYGNAKVCGNAIVSKSRVRDNAVVYGKLYQYSIARGDREIDADTVLRYNKPVKNKKAAK